MDEEGIFWIRVVIKFSTTTRDQAVPCVRRRSARARARRSACTATACLPADAATGRSGRLRDHVHGENANPRSTVCPRCVSVVVFVLAVPVRCTAALHARLHDCAPARTYASWSRLCPRQHEGAHRPAARPPARACLASWCMHAAVEPAARKLSHEQIDGRRRPACVCGAVELEPLVVRRQPPSSIGVHARHACVPGHPGAWSDAATAIVDKL